MNKDLPCFFTFLFQLFHEQKQFNNNSKPLQVPQFYFPFGKPLSAEENETVLQRIRQLFNTLPENKAYKNQMEEVSKVNVVFIPQI